MRINLKVTKDIIEVLPSITLKRTIGIPYSRVTLSFAWIIFSFNISTTWK
jgi:hypothetical protein